MGKLPKFPAVAVYLAAALILAAGVLPARWPTDLGNAGRTGHVANLNVTPPVTLLGQFVAPGPNLPNVNLMLDDAHVVLTTLAAITVWPRVDRLGRPEPFPPPEPLWHLRIFDEEAPDQLLTTLQLADTAALHEGQLVYVERRISITAATAALVARRLTDGEETWRFELEPCENPTMLMDGSTLYVRYERWNQDPPQKPVLARLRVGDTAFRASTTMEEDPRDLYTMVADSRHVYTVEGYGVAAHRVDDLSLAWRWVGPLEDGGVTALAATSQALIVAMRANRLLTIAPDGSVRWQRTFEGAGANTMQVTTDGNRIYTTGLDQERLFAFDFATGEPLWNAPTEWQGGGIPALISGGAVYLTSVSFEDGFQTEIFAAADGRPLQTLILGDSLVSQRYAVTGGLLYTAGALSGETGHVVQAYEISPSIAEIAIARTGRFECGVPAGQVVPLELQLTNYGPGPLRDARIQIRPLGAPVEFLLDGINFLPGSRTNPTIVIGNIDALGTFDLVLPVRPLSAGQIVIEAEIRADNRLGDSSLPSASVTIPVGPPLAPGADIAITDVEITQGIQDLRNSVPLVAGKNTMVRVYTTATQPVEGVRAMLRLTGEVSVSSLYSDDSGTRRFVRTPVAPLRACTIVQPTSDRRALGGAFDFVLPPEFTEGTPLGPVRLEIDLDPDNLLGESNRANNTVVRDIEFREQPPICMRTYSVRTTAQNGSDLRPSPRLSEATLRRATAMLPTRAIRQYPMPNLLEEFELLGFGPYEMDPGDDMDQSKILATLWVHDQTTWDPAECNIANARTLYLGVVGETNRSTSPGSNFNGIANLGLDQLIIRDRPTPDDGGVGSPPGGVTLAHEIGHNYSRLHVNCGNPDNLDASFPYHRCTIGPISGSSFFGADLFNPRRPNIIEPVEPDGDTATGDLMSYAVTRWPSDYTWSAISDELLEQQNAKSSKDELPKLTGEGGTLLITATIDRNGAALLAEVIQIPGDAMPLAKSLRQAELQAEAIANKNPDSIVLVLEDGNGAPLASTVAEGILTATERSPGYFLGAMLPFQPDAQALRLLDSEGTEIASRLRSPNAPTITILAPAGGTIAEDYIDVEWEALDDDNDPLQTMVQYSTDLGATWQTIITNAPGSSYRVEAQLLSGAIDTALIRVLVHDGFNSASAISEPFTVPMRQPLVSISTPAPNAAIPPGEPLHAIASAYDPEDGPLLGAALRWSIAGIGDVATGEEILLPALSPGVYTLTVTATDSHDQTATSSVTFTVASRLLGTAEVLAHLLNLQLPEPGNPDLNQDGLIDSADLVE